MARGGPTALRARRATAGDQLARRSPPCPPRSHADPWRPIAFRDFHTPLPSSRSWRGVVVLALHQRGLMPRPLIHRRLSHTTLARLPRRAVRRFAPTPITELQAKRALKAAALRDCGRRCVYCATPLAHETATLDHVYPRAHGGTNIAGNLVAACGPCNRMKGDLLPQEFFLRYPWAGLNFVRYARAVHRTLKRNARRAVSLSMAA